jgi:uncharacterized spore protein YtfJ
LEIQGFDKNGFYSIDSIRSFAEMNTVIGAPITTENGVTVIPISKVSVGHIGANIDIFAAKGAEEPKFGGGTGMGASITPIAFLTVGRDASINLLPIETKETNIEKIAALIEKSPDIIQRLKGAIF